jgi:membrane peptidoglycan carboxypeptidase
MKNMKNEFNGINIACIKNLDEKLKSNLKKYTLENGDINIYAMLDKNMQQKYLNLNIHKLEASSLKQYKFID